MPKAKTVDYDFVKSALIESGLRESSAKTYINKMRRILRLVFDDVNPTISKLKKNAKTIIDYVAEEDHFLNANVRKVILMSVSHLFQVYDLPIDVFEKPVKEYTSLADAEAITNSGKEMTDKINAIDFDAIKDSIKDETDPTDRLIKAFYSYLPPLRQQDLLNLIVINSGKDTSKGRPSKSPERNHINLKNNTMIINDHKTSNTHGSKKIALPFKLVAEIEKYMKSMKTRILFPLSSSGFTRRMTKLFGVSTSIFRKAYVSQKAPKMSPEELKNLAYILGHRLQTQMVSYRKPLIAGEPELEKDEPIDDDYESDSD